MENVLSILIKTATGMKSIPVWDEMMIELVPVDFVSKAIIDISTKSDSIGTVFSLANPVPINWTIFIEFIRSFGYDISLIPYESWKKKLINETRASVDGSMLSYSPIFTDSFIEFVKFPRFDCSNTYRELRKENMEVPIITKELIHKYLNYFISIGFIDPP